MKAQKPQKNNETTPKKTNKIAQLAQNPKKNKKPKTTQ
jgi:hypothetical protein